MRSRRVLTLGVAGLLATVLMPLAHAEPVTDVVAGGPPATTVGADPLKTPNFGLTLVGHSDLGSRGNNAALALAGNCAYVGNRGFNETADTAPVAIVDVSDPANPTVAGSVPGTTIATTTSRELRTVPSRHLLVVMIYEHYTDSNVQQTGVSMLLLYDIADCFHPVQVGAYDFHPLKPHEFFLWQDPVRPARVLAYVTTPFGPVQLEVIDLTHPSKPTLVTAWDGLYPQPSAQELDNSGLGNYLHSLSVSPDGRTAYLAYWDAGYYTLDTSQIANDDAHPVLTAVIPAEEALGHGVNYTLRTNGNTHSAAPVPGRPLTILTDEMYDGLGECPYGWLHVVNRANAANPVLAGEYKLPENNKAWCDSHVVRPETLPPAVEGQVSSGWVAPHDATLSSHNLTVTSHLVVVSWHGGGLQVVDTTHPAKLVQVAQYVPSPIPCAEASTSSLTGCARPAPAALQQFLGNDPVLMWSYPIVRNGLIYVVDIRNGLYVLRYNGPHADELNVPMLEGNSNVTNPVIAPAPIVKAAAVTPVQLSQEAPVIAAETRRLPAPPFTPYCDI